MSVDRDNNLDLLRAHGRCTGAMIFSIFGGCWLLLACVYSHHLRAATVGPICIAALLLAAAAWRVDKSSPDPVLNEALSHQKKRDDRTFAIINGITYGAVFLLFVVLPRVGLENYVFPGFVALVGLHFLPMPTLYRHAANTVTGIVMVIWAVFCAVVFKADGNRMAAFVALGAGVALWSSSAFALQTASRLFHAVPRAQR